MDDRDRAAPITLPRNTPVAQPEIHLTLRHRTIACALALQPPRHLFLRLRRRHAVEETRIDHAALPVIGDVGDDECRRIDARRTDDRRVAEPVFVGKFEVALIVRRAAENGAGAVFHQNKVRHIDRQRPGFVERMARADAGVEAELLGGVDVGLRGAAMPAFLDERGELRIFLRRRRGQRMIGRDGHELGTKQRVRPRGEHFQFGFAVRRGFWIERKAHQQAFRAADPVLLHQPHFVRPAIERIERVEQLLRIFGDLEKPLRQLALLDDGAGAPAEAVDHLLVRQHGLIDRVPVHFRFPPLDQTGAEEIEEHLLLVLVIGRIAGRDLAAPVERQPHGFELRLHGGDILVGPFPRMDLALHGGILRRHAEGVPAHRMQHGIAHGALHPRHHVAHRVVAHVAHMDAPRRVGEHFQHVIFLAQVGVGRGEDAALVPDFLPAGLRLGGVITFDRHWNRSRFSSFHRGRARDTKPRGRSTPSGLSVQQI